MKGKEKWNWKNSQSEVITASGMSLTNNCIRTLVQSSILELEHLKVRRDALEIVNRFLITEQLHAYGSRHIWRFVIAITSCPIVTELGRLAIQSLIPGSKILFGINV